MKISDLQDLIDRRTKDLRRLTSVIKRFNAGASLGIADEAWVNQLIVEEKDPKGLVEGVVSASVVAAVLGVSSRSLQNFRKEGMPVDGRNAYRIPAVVRWYLKREIERKTTKRTDAPLERELLKARAEERKAKAGLVQFEFRLRKGELLERSSEEARQVAKVRAVVTGLTGMCDDMEGLFNRDHLQLCEWQRKRIEEICAGFAAEPEEAK